MYEASDLTNGVPMGFYVGALQIFLLSFSNFFYPFHSNHISPSSDDVVDNHGGKGDGDCPHSQSAKRLPYLTITHYVPIKCPCDSDTLPLALGIMATG
jgi:hypothetical protein